MKFTNFAIATFITLSIAAGTMAMVPENDNFANAEVLDGAIQNHPLRANNTASKEAGEPNHAGDVGGKSVWFKWTATMTRLMQVSTNREPTQFNTLLNVYTGTTLANLVSIAFSDNIDSHTNSRSHLVFQAVAGTTYYIALDGHSSGPGGVAASGTFRLDVQPFFLYQGADFDGDGMTDMSVFRPASGDWMVNGTTRSSYSHWGTNGDIPLIASRDFEPQKTVYRPSQGIWYLGTGCCQVTQLRFGLESDIPVPENYTRNSSNFSIYRPSTGMWYIYTFDTENTTYYQFGQLGDIPVPGQYSPDNYADLAVFRPSNGNWYFTIRKNGNPQSDTYRTVHFGQEGDKPVAADYDGDGILDIAIYRPSNGTWWMQMSSTGNVSVRQWGIAEDIPTIGDYDGDGSADQAVFRPSTGTWYIRRSFNSEIQIEQFGLPGDIPMTSNRAF